jgi:UDP-N-acetyl-D-glucosamine dehydrogenase
MSATYPVMEAEPAAVFTPLELEEKIRSRTARVAVIGMGYVGLPLGLMFSAEGFPVIGFDIDSTKVEALNTGKSYIARIGSAEIENARAEGFSATSDYGLISQQDAVIICVPTPLDEWRQPDLSFIVNTLTSIAPYVHAGQLIVLESTSYPGTTEEVVVPTLERHARSGLRARRLREGPANQNVFYVAFSPEREDPGRSDIARQDIPKVVGGLEPMATKLAEALYGCIFRRTVCVSSPATAEMTKLLENTYRCVNIALVNELKVLCSRMGIDIWEVIEAAKTKPFGFQAFYPGPGLGGHCIPVDPYYLSWKAREYDFRTRFIELAGEINTAMPYNVVKSIAAALNQRKKSLNGSRILILGVAYKKDIDDLREAPALTIIELLQKEGADVRYHDPYQPFIGRGRHYDLQMHCAPLTGLGEYDCVVIITDHSDYDYSRIVAEAKLVVDTRHATGNIRSSKIVHC